MLIKHIIFIRNKADHIANRAFHISAVNFAFAALEQRVKETLFILVRSVIFFKASHGIIRVHRIRGVFLNFYIALVCQFNKKRHNILARCRALIPIRKLNAIHIFWRVKFNYIEHLFISAEFNPCKSGEQSGKKRKHADCGKPAVFRFFVKHKIAVRQFKARSNALIWIKRAQNLAGDCVSLCRIGNIRCALRTVRPG